jgi:chromosome segregation ATPase
MDLQQTQAALKEAEAELSKLTPKRTEIERSFLDMPANDWRRFQAKEQLRILSDQIERLTLEACGLRIALKESELAAARAAIEPLQKEFDAAMARFGDARREADAVGFLVQQARANVSGIESSIRENENRIEQISHARARRAA